jgi:hypothetical protein
MLKIDGFWLGWGDIAGDFSDAKIFQGNSEAYVAGLKYKKPDSSIEVFEIMLEEKYDKVYVSNIEEMLRDKKLNDLLN